MAEQHSGTFKGLKPIYEQDMLILYAIYPSSYARLYPYLRVHGRQRERATRRDSRRPFRDCTEVRGTMSSFKTTEVQNSLVVPAMLGPQKPPGGENAQQVVPACQISMLFGLM